MLNVETAELNRGPELHRSQEEVPLEKGEEAQKIGIEISLDGGYMGNHFYVPIGRNFPLLDIDKRNCREICSSIAWVNSREYADYLSKIAEEKPEIS